jgi:hypothetical protein
LLFYGQETLATLARAASSQAMETDLSSFLDTLAEQVFAAVSANLPAVEAGTAV